MIPSTIDEDSFGSSMEISRVIRRGDEFGLYNLTGVCTGSMKWSLEKDISNDLKDLKFIFRVRKTRHIFYSNIQYKNKEYFVADDHGKSHVINDDLYVYLIKDNYFDEGFWED